MDNSLVIKFESGSLDWTEKELEQLDPWMREVIEKDLIEEVEHQELVE